jgi:hypothetical protein
VQIHIATAAMVSGKMKHDTYTCNRLLSNHGIFEVSLNKLNPTVVGRGVEYYQPATAQVIHDSHSGFTVN